MTFRKLVFGLSAFLLFDPVAGSVRAQTSDAGSEAEAAAAIAPFEALELSARLARLGQARSDPWLLATAARLRASGPPAPPGSVRTARRAVR